MAANVETMFYTREKPWHGLGTMVKDSPSSVQALSLAGLDWKVEQHPIITTEGIPLTGFWANVRDTDKKVLGVVSDKYKVVQNEEAFAFTDTLLGEGVTYETAGSLQEGRKVWLLAKLPQRYIISGDEITPYLVFSNSHDGSGAIKVALTPIRVVCNNTLNLALKRTRRTWSTTHTGNLEGKMQDAKQTLLYADNYMAELGKAFERLTQTKITDSQVLDYIDCLFPDEEGLTGIQKKNIVRMKDDLKMRTLVKTGNLTREEWLKWRTKGIGGSDVSVIAELNKFRSVFQLWLEKTGQTNPEESENKFTYFGNVLEPIVKKFMKVTGLKVRAKKALLQSEEYPFMLADLDGVIYENGEMCIFEAKTASAISNRA